MTTTTSVTRVRVEQVRSGDMLRVSHPRLSWSIDTSDPDFRAVRYEAELTLAGVTSSAVVEGDESVLVAWPFEPLVSRDEGTLRLRVGSADGGWTAWTEPWHVVAGLLEESDWSARFVSPLSLGGLDDGAPIVFTGFRLDEAPRAARLYVTAHGVYEPMLNGQRVGEDVFAPGWTPYASRLRFQSYDVTDHVRTGENTLAALIGNGWYRGQLTWTGNRSSYGDRLALLAQLELDFADGSRRIIATDADWRASPSGILFDDFYDGERRDLRLSNLPDVARSEPVDVLDASLSRLVARRGPAVRETGRVKPTATLTSPSGRHIVDFGQNLVGWVELVVRGSAGNEVVVRHAEVLEHGELAMVPLRTAKATCAYLLAGEGAETLRPTFTFSGFRYIDVAGVDPEAIESITAIVLGTDLERTGWLTTSDARLNRLHENAVWSTRGNFVDLPTDCPQRDERLGWTGDIQVFGPTADFLFDTSGFLAGWLEDLAAEQLDDGTVPFVIPNILPDEDQVATGWGDAAVIVPAELYRSFADEGMLRRQYPSMQAWVAKIESLADADLVWNAGQQFGDWLDPTSPPEDPAAAKADRAVVATAYFARSTKLLAEAAGVLGFAADAERYARLADGIAAGFQRRFVDADGRVFSDCQTVYALALCGDLISDPTTREGAGRRLAELVSDAGFRVATGFLGTPLILDALVLAGRTDYAYRMLLQTEVPSWLYAVTMGATTIWERWDSMLPDGSVNAGSMTSFNHYAYGAVADWMHRVIGGIAALTPAYRTFEVRPLVTRDLEHASARHISPYGEIAVSWRREDAAVRLEVTVPYGTEASVWVPGRPAPQLVGPGEHSFDGVIAAPDALAR